MSINPVYKEISIDLLKKYTQNSRTHSPAQVKQLCGSIKEYGFTNPLLIDEDNQIIAGHCRLDAATKLKYKSVPCIVLSHLTADQKRAYVIADNKLALNAGWNEDMLKSELVSLRDNGFDMTLTGFDAEELTAVFGEVEVVPGCDEDEVPEVVSDPVCKLGDVWILGEHRLMCGDATTITDVDRLMDGEKADMVFTDPPYGISIVGKDGSVGGGTKGRYRPIINDHNTNVAVDAYNLCISININNIFFWGANHYSHIFPSSSCWVVWDKQDGKHVSFADCELAYTNYDKPSRLFKHVWDGFRRDSEKGENRVHPTQKPVQLIIDIFSFFECPKIIIDLFGGSGSTLIACEKTKRKCYMMELDPRYCDVIIQRWEKYTGNRAVLHG